MESCERALLALVGFDRRQPNRRTRRSEAATSGSERSRRSRRSQATLAEADAPTISSSGIGRTAARGLPVRRRGGRWPAPTLRRRRPSCGTSRGGCAAARPGSWAELVDSEASASRAARRRRGRSAAPPSGSGTIPSITPSSRQCAASGLNARAAFFAAGVAPEDRRAALGRDHGVDRVLLHQHPVGDGERDRRRPSRLRRSRRRRSERRAGPSPPASGRSRRPGRAARPRRPDRHPACRRA